MAKWEEINSIANRVLEYQTGLPHSMTEVLVRLAPVVNDLRDLCEGFEEIAEEVEEAERIAKAVINQVMKSDDLAGVLESIQDLGQGLATIAAEVRLQEDS